MSFAQNAGEHQNIWMEAVQKLGNASKLDPKIAALAYLAVLTALRMESGIPFHVKHAKILGATHDEIISTHFNRLTGSRKYCYPIASCCTSGL